MFRMLCNIHRSVGGAEETIFCCRVFRVVGDAYAGHRMEDKVLAGERRIQAAFNANSDLLVAIFRAGVGAEAAGSAFP